jgi:transcriptional antiterminator RfaH
LGRGLFTAAFFTRAANRYHTTLDTDDGHVVMSRNMLTLRFGRNRIQQLALDGAMYWSVCRTETQRETLAKSCLEATGFEVLFPRVKTGSRTMPLFANYLFVALGELGAGWHAVNRTIGVLKLVAFGDRPARVPDQEIDRLKTRMRDGFVTLPPPGSIRRRFVKGEPVRIVAGPFAGLSAIHSGMSGSAREIVLLELLGGPTRVAIDRALVMAR